MSARDVIERSTCSVPVDSFNGGEQISFAVAMFNMVAVQSCGKPAIGRRGDGHWCCTEHNRVIPLKDGE